MLRRETERTPMLHFVSNGLQVRRGRGLWISGLVFFPKYIDDGFCYTYTSVWVEEKLIVSLNLKPTYIIMHISSVH